MIFDALGILALGEVERRILVLIIHLDGSWSIHSYLIGSIITNIDLLGSVDWSTSLDASIIDLVYIIGDIDNQVELVGNFRKPILLKGDIIS